MSTRARAAVAFAANDLRADQALHAAQIVRQRQKRIAATNFVATAIHANQQMVEHVGTPSSPPGRVRLLMSCKRVASLLLILHYLKACSSAVNETRAGRTSDMPRAIIRESQLDSVHSQICHSAHRRFVVTSSEDGDKRRKSCRSRNFARGHRLHQRIAQSRWLRTVRRRRVGRWRRPSFDRAGVLSAAADDVDHVEPPIENRFERRQFIAIGERQTFQAQRTNWPGDSGAG